MLPLELNHNFLRTTNVPESKWMNRVLQTLQTIVSQKIIPYFRNYRGVSLEQLTELRQTIVFRRMEDEANRIMFPTLLLRQKRISIIFIHEKLFDHLAYVFRPARSLRKRVG